MVVLEQRVDDFAAHEISVAGGGIDVEPLVLVEHQAGLNSHDRDIADSDKAGTDAALVNGLVHVVAGAWVVADSLMTAKVGDSPGEVAYHPRNIQLEVHAAAACVETLNADGGAVVAHAGVEPEAIVAMEARERRQD